MTSPTQAQIDAAAKAIARETIHPLSVSAEGADPEEGWEYHRGTAKAAITAAGESTESVISTTVENVKAETIERCAQVAKGCHTGAEAAIRIRALAKQEQTT